MQKMASSLDIIIVAAECLCKTHSFSTEIHTSTLPLPAYACHCNSCRHATGALYSVHLSWPEPRQRVDTSHLRSYSFSANVSILFCGTCSTPLFFEFLKDAPSLGVFSGTLKNLDVNLMKIAAHFCVSDTLDGGATMWLQRPETDGSSVPRFKTVDRSQQYPCNWPSGSPITGYEGRTGQKLTEIQCHCKGIDLLLKHGNYEGKNRAELPWFIDPKTHKPTATFDACDSCRLQSGADTFHWTFSELANISLSAALRKRGKVFPKTTSELKARVDMHDSALGTLSYYHSSSNVQRYFCKVCSATVLYAVDERPEVVEVAIGLLQAPDGARAESLLSWDFGGPLVYARDTKGGWREDLTYRTQDEAEEWRIERGYPKNWRRCEKEKNEGQGN